MTITDEAQDAMRYHDQLAEQMHTCTYSGELCHRSEMVADMLGNLVYINYIDKYAESQELTQGEIEFMYNQIRRNNE